MFLLAFVAELGLTHNELLSPAIYPQSPDAFSMAGGVEFGVIWERRPAWDSLCAQTDIELFTSPSPHTLPPCLIVALCSPLTYYGDQHPAVSTNGTQRSSSLKRLLASPMPPSFSASRFPTGPVPVYSVSTTALYLPYSPCKRLSHPHAAPLELTLARRDSNYSVLSFRILPVCVPKRGGISPPR